MVAVAGGRRTTKLPCTARTVRLRAAPESSIAQSRGVSQQTLIGSIQNALTPNGSTASGPQLQQAATHVADRTRAPATITTTAA